MTYEIRRTGTGTDSAIILRDGKRVVTLTRGAFTCSTEEFDALLTRIADCLNATELSAMGVATAQVLCSTGVAHNEALREGRPPIDAEDAQNLANMRTVETLFVAAARVWVAFGDGRAKEQSK
jgi:hypothetical protein